MVLAAAAVSLLMAAFYLGVGDTVRHFSSAATWDGLRCASCR